MRKLVFDLVWSCGALFWAIVCLKARPLSVRYNAWATGLRAGPGSRVGKVSSSPAPPSSTRMLEINTGIMTWVIRVAAIWFTIFSLLALAASLLSR